MDGQADGNGIPVNDRRRWRALTLLCGLLWVVLGAQAATFEEGFSAYREGDIDRARTLWEAAAAAGDSRSMFSLGSLYMRGTVVPKDATQGYRWFRRAAEAGLPQAQYNVAFMLEQGNGVERDAEAAIGWYERAARAGLPQAQAAYASRLWDGRGVEANPVAAKRWFEAAARQGHPEAQNSLGTMLENGIGIAADPVMAAMWYERAAQQGLRDAQASLARLYREGRGVRADGERAEYWAARARGEREDEAVPGSAPETPAAEATEEAPGDDTPAATAKAVPPVTEEAPGAAADAPSDAAPAAERETPPATTAAAPAPARQSAAAADDRASAAGAAPEGWFATAPADHFTAQLIGSRSPDALERFVRQNGLDGQAELLSTRRDGGDWYLVVYGDFASASAAQAALDTLPAAARKHGPWVRRIGDVRKLLSGD
jgi:hypothetical protein